MESTPLSRGFVGMFLRLGTLGTASAVVFHLIRKTLPLPASESISNVIKIFTLPLPASEGIPNVMNISTPMDGFAFA